MMRTVGTNSAWARVSPYAGVGGRKHRQEPDKALSEAQGATRTLEMLLAAYHWPC